MFVSSLVTSSQLSSDCDCESVESADDREDFEYSGDIEKTEDRVDVVISGGSEEDLGEQHTGPDCSEQMSLHFLSF